MSEPILIVLEQYPKLIGIDLPQPDLCLYLHRLEMADGSWGG